MFPRIIVVTTGSGIGQCLSFTEDVNRPAMRVLWQTHAPSPTYGLKVLFLVSGMDPEAVMLETRKGQKKVYMVPLVLKMVEEFGAEAVCVVSNPLFTRGLVFALESRGVRAYGPILDS